MKAKEVVQVTSVTVRVLNGAKKLKVGWGRSFGGKLRLRRDEVI